MMHGANGVGNTQAEEKVSAVVHGVATVLAAAGMVAMLIAVTGEQSGLKVVSVGVFGACMVAVYLSSTLAHALPAGRAGRVLLECDHIAIYLLIAGTYTPLMLVALGGAWGWSIFGAVWGLAVAGILLRLLPGRRLSHPSLSIAGYIVMGWIGLVAVVPLVEALSLISILLILAGGVAYTGGIGFFVWHRLPYHHTIWHLFVVAGTACHFAAIWREVVMSGPG